MLADRRKAGPFLTVDGGESLAPPIRTGVVATEALEQRRIKADLIAETYARGGIDAMALGASDWALGTTFVTELVTRLHLPVLAANLTCNGATPFPSGKVLESNGKRVGVVGVTMGEVEGCEVSDPIPAIARAVAELGPVDVVLGLVPTDTDRNAAALYAADLPLDLALDARGRSVSGGAQLKNHTVWFSGGSRGKTVGFAELSFNPAATGWTHVGEAEKIAKQIELDQVRVDTLDERIAKHPDDPDLATLKSQRDGYAKRLVTARASLEVAGDASTRNTVNLTDTALEPTIADHPDIAPLVAAAKQKVAEVGGEGAPSQFVPRKVEDAASPYIGGEACAACHKPEHAQWSTTAHARAWQSLVTADRALDDACWSCHVTAAKAPGGPETASTTGPYRDVQCEACHGPGRAHANNPAAAAVIRDPAADACVACHDGDRDGGRFDLDVYRPKIDHSAVVPPATSTATPESAPLPPKSP